MKTIHNKITRDEKMVYWFSSLVRWTIGIFFILSGIIYSGEGGWSAIAFGTLIFITGFFKPKRCMNDCGTDHT